MVYTYFQYPNHVEPISTAQETVTESRWHQPWSERPLQKIKPALAIALAASGLFFTPTSPEATAVDKWQRPLSEPIRRKGPPTAEQQACFYTGADPFPETVTEDRWHQPWSEPVRLKRLAAAQNPELFFVGPQATEVVTEDKWHYAWSEPVRFKKLNTALVASGNVFVGFAPFPETVTEDRWHQQWSQPYRVPARLITAANPAAFLDPFPLPTQTTYQWAEARTVKWVSVGVGAQYQQALFWAAPNVAAATFDTWFFSPFTDPPKRRVLPAASQQAAFYIGAAPFPETVTESRWHQPWSDPVRRKSSHATQPSFYNEVLPIVASPGSWWRPLVEPVRAKLLLRPALQTALHYTTFVPTPAVTWGWYDNLATPTRPDRLFRAYLQRAATIDPTRPATLYLASLAATEQGDLFLGILSKFNIPLSAYVDIIENDPRRRGNLGIIENVAQSSILASIVEPETVPSTGAAVSTVAGARVAIIVS